MADGRLLAHRSLPLRLLTATVIVRRITSINNSSGIISGSIIMMTNEEKALCDVEFA